jgi:putative membrane protein
MYGPSDGGWWGFGMMFISLLFLTLIVVGAVLVARSFSRPEQPPKASQGSRALDILDERFAHGEIDRSEYEERRNALTGGG